MFLKMSGQNQKRLSISLRIGEGVIEHNREFIAKNVDRERIQDNIVYQREDLREFYQKLFGQALVDYNVSKAILSSEYLSTIFNHKSVSEFQSLPHFFKKGQFGFQGFIPDEMLD